MYVILLKPQQSVYITCKKIQILSSKSQFVQPTVVWPVPTFWTPVNIFKVFIHTRRNRIDLVLIWSLHFVTVRICSNVPAKFHLCLGTCACTFWRSGQKILNKPIKIALKGDSICIFMLYNLSMTIKKWLLRASIIAVKERCREIIQLNRETQKI